MARKNAKPRAQTPANTADTLHFENLSPGKFAPKTPSSTAECSGKSTPQPSITSLPTGHPNPPHCPGGSSVSTQPSGSSVLTPTRASKPATTKFVVYSSKEANREVVPGLTARALASDIPVKQLWLLGDQKKEIHSLHQDKANIVDHVFAPGDLMEQEEAQRLLEGYGLDDRARSQIGGRWSTRWRDKGSKTGSEVLTERVLYQCKCGSSDEARGSKIRHTTYSFTACLGHCEIVYVTGTKVVLRIRGYFHHNEMCRSAKLARLPPFPLHPDVWKVALDQLSDGSTWGDIREKNSRLVRTRGYISQPKNWEESQYRWVLKQGDSRSLYRQHQRLGGVDVNNAPHRNVDSWLDRSSPEYHPVLAEAVFHYAPRTKNNDRFEVCIATPDMNDAAWRYGHGSQIIMDGTFGVCNSKILLFILMALDDERKGVPIAFFLFSAPSGNKFTAGGYNTEVLARLLGKWKTSLGQRDAQAFFAKVAITDSDSKERNALFEVFPNIWLLLCKFHLRQCWTNHRKRHLKSDSPMVGAAEIAVRLLRIEEALIKSLEHSEAVGLIESEKETLELLKTVDQSAAAAADGGIAHLDYLIRTWVKHESVWKSWSDHGRHIAAALLGCTFEGVLPTTNHLESFNEVLKNKHLRRWRRNNRPLRLDVLVRILTLKVLPSIFHQRALRMRQRKGWETRVRAAGAEHLLTASEPSIPAPPTLAYLAPNEARDNAAKALLDRKQVGAPSFDLNTKRLTFQCYSAGALSVDKTPIVYDINVDIGGATTCTCPDFQHRGGACKHIRAAILSLDALRQMGKKIPSIPIPTSEGEARALEGLFASTLTSLDAPRDGTGPIQKAVESIEDELREGQDIYEEKEGEDALGGDSTDTGEDDRVRAEHADWREFHAQLTEEATSVYASASEMDWSEPGHVEEREVVVEVEEKEKDEERTGQAQTVKNQEPEKNLTVKEPSAAPKPNTVSIMQLGEGEAKASINAQTLIRAFHELDVLAPRIGSIAEQLGRTHLDATYTTELEQADAAWTHANALCIELQRLRLEAEHGEQPKGDQGPDKPSMPQQQRVSKWKRTKRKTSVPSNSEDDILPASPQRAQKRKVSHGAV